MIVYILFNVRTYICFKNRKISAAQSVLLNENSDQSSRSVRRETTNQMPSFLVLPRPQSISAAVLIRLSLYLSVCLLVCDRSSPSLCLESETGTVFVLFLLTWQDSVCLQARSAPCSLTASLRCFSGAESFLVDFNVFCVQVCGGVALDGALTGGGGA